MTPAQAPDSRFRFRALSNSALLITTVFLLIFTLATNVPSDPDMWWHLSSGEWMLDNGTLMRTDVFSHTFYGETRVQHEWLGQIIMALIYRTAGDVGLALATSGLAMTGLFFLWRTARGGWKLKLAVTLLATTAAMTFWSPRTQMATFVLTAVTIGIVYDYKWRKKNRLWLLPPIFALWVNLHGAWPLGALILLATAGGELLNIIFRRNGEDTLTPRQWLTFVLFSAGAAAALLLNPFGIDMVLAPIEQVSIPSNWTYIQEWQPPNFAEPQFWGLGALLVVTVLLMVRDFRRLDFVQVLMVFIAAYLSLRTARSTSYIAVVAMPVVCDHLYALLKGRTWRLPGFSPQGQRFFAVSLCAAALIISGIIITLKLVPSNIAEVRAKRFPVDAVAFMQREQLPRNLYNAFDYGGYLIFYAPEYPVFIDGRVDLYRDFTEDYIRVVYGLPPWQDTLNRYQVNTLMLREDYPLVQVLVDHPEWELVYQDDLALLYVRRVPEIVSGAP